MQDQGFSKVLTLNLQRVFTLTQKLLPLLRAGAVQGGQIGGVFNDPCRIINVRAPSISRTSSPDSGTHQIGSVEGLAVPDRDTYAYSAAKAGLHHMSRHLAGRLGKEGILSNTIACGALGFPVVYSYPQSDLPRLQELSGANVSRWVRRRMSAWITNV